MMRGSCLACVVACCSLFVVCCCSLRGACRCLMLVLALYVLCGSSCVVWRVLFGMCFVLCAACS